MSSARIPVVAKRKLDFTSLANGSTQDLLLADRQELTSWSYASLLVAISQHTLSNGAGTISILAIPQSFTDEDPASLFLSTIAFAPEFLPNTTAPTFGVQIDSNTPSPGYLNTNLPMLGANCVGAMVRIIARGTRTASAGTLQADVSVELAVTDA